MTTNEESSGIIDLSAILGEGYFLANVQAHYSTGDIETVEGGQLLVINTNASSATLENGVLVVERTVNEDEIFVDESGRNLLVYVNGQMIGEFRKSDVDVIEVYGGAGGDTIRLDRTIAIDSILKGGLGNDTIYGANGRDRIFGEEGDDRLFGLNNKVWLDGGDGFDELWGGNGVDELLNGEIRF